MLAHVGDPAIAYGALSAPTISANLTQETWQEGGTAKRNTVGARFAASIAILAGREKVMAEFGAGLD